MRNLRLSSSTEWKYVKQKSSFLYFSGLWQRINCCSVTRLYRRLTLAFKPYSYNNVPVIYEDNTCKSKMWIATYIDSDSVYILKHLVKIVKMWLKWTEEKKRKKDVPLCFWKYKSSRRKRKYVSPLKIQDRTSHKPVN